MTKRSLLTRDDVVRTLRAFHERTGRWPCLSSKPAGWRDEDLADAVAVGLPTYTQIRVHFRLLRDAFSAAAGVVVQSHSAVSLSTDELIELARRFKAKVGRYPKMDSGARWLPADAAVAAELGMPSCDAYRRRFKGIARAWAAAEGKPVQVAAVSHKRLADDELLDLLNVYRHLAGDYPVTAGSGYQWAPDPLIASLGVPNRGTYRTRFGTYKAAKTLAEARPLNTTMLEAYTTPACAAGAPA